jgi:mRNA interferase MazF
VVPFPFVDVPVAKKRPALVLSNAEFNSQNGHCILAMITTAKVTAWPSDYFLGETSSVGLSKACYVRWKLFTLSNDMIISKLGRLSDDDGQQVRQKINAILGFTAPAR